MKKIKENVIMMPNPSQDQQIVVTDENLVLIMNEQKLQLQRQQALFNYILEKQKKSE